MLVEIGNHDPVLVTPAGTPLSRPPNGYLTTTMHIPDPHVCRNNGAPVWTLEDGLDVNDFRNHLAKSLSRGGITQRPDHEALVSVCHLRDGIVPAHANAGPAWAHVDPGDADNPDSVSAAARMQRYLSEFYQVPEGRPANYEGDYWRKVGKRLIAPGVTGLAALPPLALVTNAGRLIWDDTLGGGQVGATGTGTAATATTLTTQSTFTVNQWAGYRVYVYSTTGTLIVWGNIASNTNAAGASVLTVDQWYVAATPGGAAATTPTTPWSFMIADGGSLSAWFQGISTTNITPAATDVSLSGEATTQGMARKITAFAITSATTPTTFTWTVTYTFTGSSSTTFYAASHFTSNVIGDTTDTMVTEDLLSASATVATNGDQVVTTSTQTGP